MESRGRVGAGFATVGEHMVTKSTCSGSSATQGFWAAPDKGEQEEAPIFRFFRFFALFSLFPSSVQCFPVYFLSRLRYSPSRSAPGASCLASNRLRMYIDGAESQWGRAASNPILGYSGPVSRSRAPGPPALLYDALLQTSTART